MSYSIDDHCHLASAWVAGRAASVKGKRFSVEKGRTILEDIGFRPGFSKPESLPTASEMDKAHRIWREQAIVSAESKGLTFTHGVASKLINCYLKTRFVCGGHHLHEKVRSVHPPIDAVLLKKLFDLNVGGRKAHWRIAMNIRWSNLNSDQYEEVIGNIREHLSGEPLWMIEEHWKGNQ